MRSRKQTGQIRIFWPNAVLAKCGLAKCGHDLPTHLQTFLPAFLFYFKRENEGNPEFVESKNSAPPGPPSPAAFTQPDPDWQTANRSRRGAQSVSRRPRHLQPGAPTVMLRKRALPHTQASNTISFARLVRLASSEWSVRCEPGLLPDV